MSERHTRGRFVNSEAPELGSPSTPSISSACRIRRPSVPAQSASISAAWSKRKRAASSVAPRVVPGSSGPRESSPLLRSSPFVVVLVHSSPTSLLKIVRTLVAALARTLRRRLLDVYSGPRDSFTRHRPGRRGGWEDGSLFGFGEETGSKSSAARRRLPASASTSVLAQRIASSNSVWLVADYVFFSDLLSRARRITVELV